MQETVIKIKKMTAEEMILAADRLTRFKAPEVKYNRVFREMISKYLIEPKISFKEYEKLHPQEISQYIEKIFSSSLNELMGKEPQDFTLLEEVKKLDENLFNIDEKTSILMQTEIPYVEILNIAEDSDLCLNLTLLKKIKTEKLSANEIRDKYKTKFPISKVVLAEGITEDILLSEFGKLLDYDFKQHGIETVAAGGKNQVAKDYLQLITQLKVPIIVLLDADAQTIAEQIRNKLRPQDKLLLIEKGEFEDILPTKLLARAINYSFQNFFTIEPNEFSKEGGRVKELEELYRVNHLGEFKKAEFAHNVKTVLEQNAQDCISAEIHNIIEEIKTL